MMKNIIEENSLHEGQNSMSASHRGISQVSKNAERRITLMTVASWFYGLLAVSSGLLILAAALLITYSAFSRFFVGGSSIWESELSVYLLMASVWLGCGPAMFANRHVSISILHKVGGHKLTLVLNKFSLLICIAVGLVLTLKGSQAAIAAILGDWHSSSLWAPSLIFPYLFIPIGMIAFVLAAAIRLFYIKRNF